MSYSVEAPTVSFDPLAEVPTTYDVGIVGAGLAGLAAAIRIRESFPNQHVVLIEKPSPQSNTQIAGQRYRFGIAGKRQDPAAEMQHLLASRNDGILTPDMEAFVDLATVEVERWQASPDFVQYNDKPEWFGPQWGAANRAGKGRGKSVLSWFQQRARDAGVSTIQGEVQHLENEDGHITRLVTEGPAGPTHIAAARYVLAAGSAGGSLFLSTNKDIAYSAQELAFNASIPLVDSTTHMIHPFGNCDAAGNPRLGCFETDELADATVYLDGTSNHPVLDVETTELLREHQAHYRFPEIAQRFREHGSVVRLDLGDGRQTYARVSYHYSHLAVETTDGITVRGVDNLYAVGDAAGLGHWTNHHERFPGFALLKCLTDAALLADTLQNAPPTHAVAPRQSTHISPRPAKSANSKAAAQQLKQLNTLHLDRYLTAQSPDDKARTGQEWLEALQAGAQSEPSSLHVLSAAIAHAHQQVAAGKATEPFRVDKHLGTSLLTS
jgi:aspartate oxidase